MKKIIIDKPCSVKWNSMKKIDGGRFCGVCNHEVRDYSNKSANEIAEMIEELSTQSLCAKFKTEHVIVPDGGQPQTLISRYLAVAVITVLMLFGCKSKKRTTTYGNPRYLEDTQKTEQKNGRI